MTTYALDPEQFAVLSLVGGMVVMLLAACFVLLLGGGPRES